MKRVIHQNFVLDSNDGKIYCHKIRKVARFNAKRCNSCDMCFGSLQGMGVECNWEDADENYPIYSVNNPNAEKKRVDSLFGKK